MNIGFIGLGMMGSPMATRLQRAGHTLFIYNRTKEKADAFIANGAIWCDSPAGVAEKAEAVVSMLSTPDVLETLSLGKKGILEGLGHRSVHVDCSTVSPELTQRLHEEYTKKECHFVHSPVLGSVPNAAEGSLLLFAGSDAKAFEKVESILRCFGSKVWRFDRVEQATNTKLLCNFFIASMISGLAQGLVFAENNGIDPKTFLEILAHSALNAPTYQTKGAQMVQNNFAPRFFLEHMLKDITLLLDAAGRSKTAMPTAEIVRDLYSRAVDAGLAKEDYSAVIKVLRSRR